MPSRRGFEPISDLPVLDRLPGRIFGKCQAYRVDHSLIREVELPMQVEMRPGSGRTMANRFEQLRPRCRPWRATRRPVVRGRRRARTDFRSGGGVCFPEPAEKICKGIRHAVQPFVGGVGLGGRLVESRSDRRAAAAKKSLSAVLESLRQRMHPQVSRKDTRHSG